MPQESAARESQSRHVLCTPYNHAPCHFMQSYIRKVYACLAVTCHLRFWQDDRGLLRATAVIRGWNRYQNKTQHRKLTLEKKILPPPQQGFEPTTFNHESGALTTELSPLPIEWWVGTRERLKRMLFIRTETTPCTFSGWSPFLSYKTTLQQQLNDSGCYAELFNCCLNTVVQGILFNCCLSAGLYSKRGITWKMCVLWFLSK